MHFFYVSMTFTTDPRVVWSVTGSALVEHPHKAKNHKSAILNPVGVSKYFKEDLRYVGPW